MSEIFVRCKFHKSLDLGLFTFLFSQMASNLDAALTGRLYVYISVTFTFLHLSCARVMRGMTSRYSKMVQLMFTLGLFTFLFSRMASNLDASLTRRLYVYIIYP